MKPRIYPLEIHQGALFSRGFRLKGRGVPLDLTGYTARMQIRERADEASPVLLDLSIGAGLSIDVPESRVLIVISGQSSATPSTAKLDFDRAVYDLFIFSPTGEPQKVAGGLVQYVRAVTHVD